MTTSALTAGSTNRGSPSKSKTVRIKDRNCISFHSASIIIGGGGASIIKRKKYYKPARHSSTAVTLESLTYDSGTAHLRDFVTRLDPRLTA
jgi:hypothetical protein